MSSKRAQTTADFAIAIGVFLLAVGGIIAAAHGLFAPYEEPNQKTVAAERLAEELTTNTLTYPWDSSSKLDQTCTVAFFDKYQDGQLSEENTPGEHVDCSVSLTADSLNDAVGLHNKYFVSISIEHLNGTVASHNGVKLQAGASGSSQSQVAIETRTVTLQGEPYVLRVEVW